MDDLELQLAQLKEALSAAEDEDKEGILLLIQDLKALTQGQHPIQNFNSDPDEEYLRFQVKRPLS